MGEGFDCLTAAPVMLSSLRCSLQFFNSARFPKTWQRDRFDLKPAMHAPDPTPEILQAMVILAFYTGLRRGEIFNLEWTDFQIDMGKRDYRVHVNPKSKWGWTPKSNLGRVVGFNPVVWQYLTAMRDSRAERLKKYRERLNELTAWKEDRENGAVPEIVPNVFSDFKQRPSVQRLIDNTRSVIVILERQTESTLAFPGTMGERLTEIPKAFDNTLVALGMKEQPGSSFHALRHSFASHLIMAGVDLPTVKDLMGHADIKTTMRYAHLAPAHRSAAGAKMPTLQPESGRAKEGRNDGANVIDMTGTS